MRDSNPMPALTQVQKMAKTALAEAGLDMDRFFVAPAETPDGVSYVQILVHPSPDKPDEQPDTDFEALVGQIPDDVQEAKSEEARKNLTDLQERLKKRGGGILD